MIEKIEKVMILIFIFIWLLGITLQVIGNLYWLENFNTIVTPKEIINNTKKMINFNIAGSVFMGTSGLGFTLLILNKMINFKQKKENKK